MESFKTFTVYCGLALHHAKLYDKIRRSEQKYKVYYNKHFESSQKLLKSSFVNEILVNWFCVQLYFKLVLCTAVL